MPLGFPIELSGQLNKAASYIDESCFQDRQLEFSPSVRFWPACWPASRSLRLLKIDEFDSRVYIKLAIFGHRVAKSPHRPRKLQVVATFVAGQLDSSPTLKIGRR